MLHRVKQFYWAIESYFKPIDKEYINKFLSEDEKSLFNKLKRGEQQHCIRVSKNAINISKEKKYNIDERTLAKVSLLHDIGKSEHNLNIIQKSIMVILNKITDGKLEKYDKIKSIDIYYNHGKKGVKLLQDINKYDDDFLYVIENHHKKSGLNNNRLLDIVKESDNKS